MEDRKERMRRITEEFLENIVQKAMKSEEKPLPYLRGKERKKIGILVATRLKINLANAYDIISFILKLYTQKIPGEEMTIRTRHKFLSLTS